MSSENLRWVNKIYRDRENGWIFGVCAGIAEYANFRVGTIRIIALLSLLIFFWPAVFIYVAATLLIRDKPLTYTGRRAEYEFWRRQTRGDRWSHT